MIGKLTGRLLEKHPPQIVLEAGGVGYELDVPMSTLYVLPQLGETVALHTHLTIREDAHLLYGFATRTERDTFRILIRVTGIGPKIGLALLSGMSAEELASAIEGEDVACLSRVPGIGKKTAERLVLELRGKLAATSAPGNRSPVGSRTAEAAPHQDITHALLALGYNEREAAAAVKLLPADTGVNEGIRLALKSLSRA